MTTFLGMKGGDINQRLQGLNHARRAINGRDKAGKPLLKQDVNPSRPDSPDRSPLFHMMLEGDMIE